MTPTPITRCLCAAFLLGCFAVTPVMAAPLDAPVTDLVQRFTAAQNGFDVAALKALTSADYIEISPLGEVDPRDKMLSFYVKKDDKPRPTIGVDDMTTRMLGDTALVTARVFYTMEAGDGSRTFSLRSTFVAQRQGGAWKLVSSQYTPIRQAPVLAPAAPAR